MFGFQDIPPMPMPDGSGFHWQTVAWIVMILVSATSAIFAAWVKLSEKRLDIDREADAKKLALEIESLKFDFEQRKSFTDRIIAECERAKEGETKAREEVWKVLTIVNERDKTIREQHDMIFELKSKVSKLEMEINQLKLTVNGTAGQSKV
jgi:predicted RNase H-like nuclease (RuvC/YqgF family)